MVDGSMKTQRPGGVAGKTGVQRDSGRGITAANAGGSAGHSADTHDTGRGVVPANSGGTAGVPLHVPDGKRK